MKCTNGPPLTFIISFLEVAVKRITISVNGVTSSADVPIHVTSSPGAPANVTSSYDQPIHVMSSSDVPVHVTSSSDVSVHVTSSSDVPVLVTSPPGDAPFYLNGSAANTFVCTAIGARPGVDLHWHIGNTTYQEEVQTVRQSTDDRHTMDTISTMILSPNSIRDGEYHVVCTSYGQVVAPSLSLSVAINVTNYVSPTSQTKGKFEYL